MCSHSCCQPAELPWSPMQNRTRGAEWRVRGVSGTVRIHDLRGGRENCQWVLYRRRNGKQINPVKLSTVCSNLQWFPFHPVRSTWRDCTEYMGKVLPSHWNQLKSSWSPWIPASCSSSMMDSKYLSGLGKSPKIHWDQKQGTIIRTLTRNYHFDFEFENFELNFYSVQTHGRKNQQGRAEEHGGNFCIFPGPRIGRILESFDIICRETNSWDSGGNFSCLNDFRLWIQLPVAFSLVVSDWFHSFNIPVILVRVSKGTFGVDHGWGLSASCNPPDHME